MQRFAAVVVVGCIALLTLHASTVLAAGNKRAAADRTIHISLVSCSGQGTACTNRTEEALVTIKSSALSTIRHRNSPPLGKGERTYGIRFHIVADDVCTPGLIAGVELLYSQLIDAGITPSHFGYDFYPIDGVQSNSGSSGAGGKKPDFRRLESNKPCAGQKLLVPYILPSSLDAVINLDSDLVIVDNLGKLWDQFDSYNSTQWMGLCPEHEVKNIAWYGRLSRHPFYPPYGLNSGVLPMNLTRIRSFDLSDPSESDKKQRRAIKQLSATYRADPYPLHKMFFDIHTTHYDNIVWGDQDLLNIFMHDYRHLLKLIDCKWNYRPDHCQYGHNCKVSESSTPWSGEADGESVALLHGNRQVFHNGNMPPFRNVYDFYRDYNFKPKSKAGLAITKRTNDGVVVQAPPPNTDYSECKKVMNGVLKRIIPFVSRWDITPAATDSGSGSDSGSTTADGDDGDDDENKNLDTMSGVSDDEDEDARVAAAAKTAKPTATKLSGDDDPRLWGGDEDEDVPSPPPPPPAAAKKPAAAAAASKPAAAATKKSAAERAHDDDDDDEDEAEPEPEAISNSMKLPYEFLSGDALAAAEAAGLMDPTLHVFMIFTNSNPNRHKQFVTSAESVFETTPMTAAEPFFFHFCIDSSSADQVKAVVDPHMRRLNKGVSGGGVKPFQYRLYYISEVEKKFAAIRPTLMAKMEQFFTSGGHVGGMIFFLGPLLHAVLPEVHRALQLDADIKVKTSLRVLWNRFDST